MTLGDLRISLAEMYQLEGEIASISVLNSYRNSNAPQKKRKKAKYLIDPDHTVSRSRGVAVSQRIHIVRTV